jgi:signal transduction histidine kinase
LFSRRFYVTLNCRSQKLMPEIHVGPLPTVQGWPGRLEQVFQNLIQNALKYRKPGVRPVIHIQAQDRAGDWLFHVRDNGVGFDQKDAQRIFGLFQQLHSRKQAGGMGMGLAIVRRIVERHDGQVYAEGTRGVGATFSFTWPKLVAPALHSHSVDMLQPRRIE